MPMHFAFLVRRFGLAILASPIRAAPGTREIEKPGMAVDGELRTPPPLTTRSR